MSRQNTFHKKDYIYTPLFCEENIWHLCKSLTSQGIPADSLDILFLSNIQKHIVLFNQQYIDLKQALSYDYHVILKYRPDSNNVRVFDFDTHLSFPVNWEIYQQASFPDPASLSPDLQMMIREIPASEYLECFTSDRKHMSHLPESEHPKYECIRANNADCGIDLKDYWQMDKTIKGTSKLYTYNHPSM